MGVRGPVPKRDEERVRRNVESQAEHAPGAVTIRVPAPLKDWVPQAKLWYRSLRQSGQQRFFEPSDWRYAWTLADLLHRELTAVRVVTLPTGGEVIVPVPPRALMTKTILSAMGELGTTESARRRMRIELDRQPDNPDVGGDGAITSLDQYRAAAGAG